MKPFDDFVQSFVRTEVLSHPLQVYQGLPAPADYALHPHYVLKAILRQASSH